MSKPSSPLKVVYFVRHGQSVDNASPVFQATDSPLSDKGRRQAAQIAERVRTLPFDALIASPLRRARQTAESIAMVTGKRLEVSDLLVERTKPSSVDGRPWTDQQASATFADWEKSLYTPGQRIEDGENYDDIVARADAALAMLRDRLEQTLVVVSHGHFLRTMVARVLLGDDLSGPILRRIQSVAAMENTALTVLHYRPGYQQPDPQWRLWTYNDHAHFAE